MIQNTLEFEIQSKDSLLEVASRIVDLRLGSSSPTDRKYQSDKTFEILDIERLIQNPNEDITGYYGQLGEALFYIACREALSNIPVMVSTGEEDVRGIDFFLNGLPIDVSTNPLAIDTKLRPERVATLFLPRYKGQRSLFHCDNHRKGYISEMLEEGIFSSKQFLKDLVSINKEILYLMTIESQKVRNSGPNNKTNLQTILRIIESNL